MNLQASGPADCVEARWQRLPTTWRLMHERGGSPVLSRGVLALIDAAAAEPSLRRLYPFTSHFTLWFSARTSHPFEVAAPAVEPLRDGRFRVLSPIHKRVIGEADTARAAVALVVAGLAEAPGPAA
ncbi:DUF6193 family natural product biosynthesis protein [Streptomyces sp. NBC_01343]|uniref:DUF6193 family natural product biosynthesis protein n=1 Tax=Streptomyces sp. NBC_01343 TaxID=2903832 RepID=UPI002E1323BF|nr:DUF6193 family natural product biosynthesis protein [Streptomyces sp. NBC_01343]